MKILLIDNTYICEFLLKRLLEKLGHCVDVAHFNEYEKINFQRQYDIIFLDVISSNGIELGKRIKEEKDFKGITIGISSYDFTEEEQKAMPFDRFIFKPYLFSSYIELEKMITQIYEERKLN